MLFDDDYTATVACVGFSVLALTGYALYRSQLGAEKAYARTVTTDSPIDQIFYHKPQVAEHGNNHFDLHFNLGMFNIKEKNYGAAERHFSEVLRHIPNHIPSLFYLEQIHCTSDYKGKSKSKLPALIHPEIELSCPIDRLYQAYYLYKTKTEKAIDIFLNLCIDLATANNPHGYLLPHAKYGLALCSLHQGNKTEALSVFQEILVLYPKFRDLLTATEIDVHYQKLTAHKMEL